jgi:septal ring factor EnvC (AmiA/AmiB activator)
MKQKVPAILFGLVVVLALALVSFAGVIAKDTIDKLTEAVTVQSDTDEQLHSDLVSHKGALERLNERLAKAEAEIERLKQESASGANKASKDDVQAQPTVLYGN